MGNLFNRVKYFKDPDRPSKILKISKKNRSCRCSFYHEKENMILQGQCHNDVDNARIFSFCLKTLRPKATANTSNKEKIYSIQCLKHKGQELIVCSGDRGLIELFNLELFKNDCEISKHHGLFLELILRSFQIYKAERF
jgi:hypothetical protein